MDNNNFTIKLFDVILPQKAFKDIKQLNMLFFVTEFLPFDMTNMLKDPMEEDEMTTELLIQIIYKSLCALQFIHSTNIMHRDIKPANILVSATNQIKICDFGLSRAIVSPDADDISKLLSLKDVHMKSLNKNNVNNFFESQGSIAIQSQTQES